jgi:glucose/arabinose dehydrogenase
MLIMLAQAQGKAPACASDNGGLTLPARFCALVVADQVGPARHIAVGATGDVFVAIAGGPQAGVVVLRDTTGDGVADVRAHFGPGGGTGIALRDGFLYFATNDAAVRWAWKAGQLEPAGAPDTVVAGMTNRRQHAAKGIAMGPDGHLYINIGAPSNSCQIHDRTPGSLGQDPCPLLEIAGGIWRFQASRRGQPQSDGERVATGLRNSMSMAWAPDGSTLYAIQHGRDALHDLFPDKYSDAQSAEKPAEELFKIERGGDYGWPYCYYDPELKRKVLAPEYGGDGQQVGRCAAVRQPEVAFPAHWAPNGLVFYNGTQFPAEYRGGVFVAFHGSWNRAPLPQGGYNVTFAPFANGKAVGTYTVFASGFAGAHVDPRGAAHRPPGLAGGPDGSLYVADDQGGRIYRIIYR